MKKSLDFASLYPFSTKSNPYSANEVADRVRTLREFGVDELLAAIVLLPEDGAAARQRTLALLGEIASE